MIILCADDFGLSDGISRGITDLCQAQRLSATSALVTAKGWPEQAIALRALRPTAAVGLHFNLTLGDPLLATRGAAHLTSNGSFLPLGRLVRRALARRLNTAQLRAECSAQIAAFHKATGALPDFIDGHQHVHALPIVRHAVIAAIDDHDWPQRPLLRLPRTRRYGLSGHGGAPLKEGAVNLLTRGFDDLLRSAGLPHNKTFAGFSTFAVGSDYGAELEAALAAGAQPAGQDREAPAARCHLVMCHPGYVDDALTASGDPLVERRREELDALMAADDLPRRIWHPERGSDRAIDWDQAMSR
ncbi:MAG: ChbG/HpnK family deacetylase [Hyphomicrobiaceae bacterium]